MIGKKVNEEFKIDINGEDVSFKIIEIEKITEDTPKSPRKSL